MDNSKPWETYTEWGKTYGPIMYSRLLNKDIIIINSEKIAKDLMVRRSANFSDRPVLVTNVLFGQDWNAAFMHYGDRWRQCRRLLHQAFRPEAALTYRPVQMQKAYGFLLNRMESPENYPDHLRTYVVEG
ncbi:hypothetical protein SERLA73DRAFT_108547 [Serpula lacrymans var. lacrymans S7.3]|uniref:Cytochrome P450 n=1 Tax=Serpula lacrymans var. lacrymans (strain S7.3) TaxID=936435 RepID=F8PZ63_SERL3|nr:hypothetical protein SERLA73DRAFT_108547 [Serpula lacrymans var. lacrymans S7.3]